MTLDLPAFLHARLDDETEALDALTRERRWYVDPGNGRVVEADPDEKWADGADRLPNNHGYWVPLVFTEQRRAEVEATRRIVRAYEDAVIAFGNTELGTDLHDIMTGSVNSLRYTLRLLTLPYAGHDDYQEEWRP